MPSAGVSAVAAFALVLPVLWTLHGVGDETLGLLPVFAASALFWFLLEAASAAVSPLLFPASYARLSPAERDGWNTRVPSLVHALFVCAVAPPLLWGGAGDSLRAQDPVRGHEASVAAVAAVSAGYFAWDTVVSVRLVRQNGVAMLVHGVLCLFVYANACRPFLQYYAVIFLCFEASTPSLNLWWFLQKTGHGGSIAQRACGLVTLACFLFVRLGFGLYNSVPLWRLSAAEWRACQSGGAGCGFFRVAAPLTLATNAGLSALNAVWFYKGVRGAVQGEARKEGKRKKRD